MPWEQIPRDDRQVLALDGDEAVVVLADGWVLLYHFGREERSVRAPVPRGTWAVALASDEAPGRLDSDGHLALDLPGRSFLVLRRL